MYQYLQVHKFNVYYEKRIRERIVIWYTSKRPGLHYNNYVDLNYMYELSLL